MNYIVTVPASTIPIDPTGKTGNKMLENIKGIIGEKSKEVTIFDGITNYGDIWKALCLAGTTMQLVLGESDYKKLFDIVKNHKGWGDFAGQVEAYEAFESATKQ